MKKIIALGLSLLLLGGSAAACAKEKTNDLLTLKYNYDLSEYIDLADYKGVPAVGYEIVVADEDVERQILTSRAYYSRLNDVERAADLGDTVYIDYSGTVAQTGDVLEEEDVELTIGGGSMFEDFENALVGAMPESELSLDLTFPDPYYTSPEYAGMDVHFDVHVHEVCEQELPEYTDDFVRAYLGYDSRAAYEKSARESLEKLYRENYYKFVANQVWPQVLENTTVKKFPDGAVDEMVSSRLEFDKAYSEIIGLNWDAYLNLYYNITDEEYQSQIREEVESRIKEEMVSFAIARLENISLSEEEYQELAAEYATKEGYASVEALEAVYAKDSIRQTLMEDKVIRRIVDLADITIEDRAE